MSRNNMPKNQYGPWNPGISSQLPRQYLPLSTMFREENVSTSLAEAQELSDFCGLAAHELVEFRAERLIIHELLVRITADLAVPDGPNYEDLGINFREIASTILSQYIEPNTDELQAVYDRNKCKASNWIAQELSDTFFSKPSPAEFQEGQKTRPWFFGFGRNRKTKPLAKRSQPPDYTVLADLHAKAAAAGDAFEAACLLALADVVGAIVGKRGRLIGDQNLISKMATTLVCNRHGSELLGESIDCYIRAAVAQEDLRLLPAQLKPVVMNVKGASASGKSTMRPLQRILAERLEVPWDDFALISPDIWRKFLLDYGTLGEAFRYAGTLTGHELELIDRKLDRYMAKKAAKGVMSHLLIDRFRFDSFVPETNGDEASKLLTRFGDLVYMFFMITPPDATVARAWKRGLKFGRYKAVDDLLDHNVEAYTGMPQLFFTWALRTKKRVHYEFLDNSVAEGEQPRTVAFGWNGEMNIFNIKCMLDIDRFRKINIQAQCAEDVYDDERMAPERNADFLKQCARRIPVINFAECRTGYVYATLRHGQWSWRDVRHLARVLEDPDSKAGLEAIGAQALESNTCEYDHPPVHLDKNTTHTLGAWGPVEPAGKSELLDHGS